MAVARPREAIQDIKQTVQAHGDFETRGRQPFKRGVLSPQGTSNGGERDGVHEPVWRGGYRRQKQL